VLQILAAVFVLFFLPGYTLINMLFPKRGELDLEYDQLYRVGLGMGMSMVISILTGYVLGYFALLYAIYIWIVLLNLSGLFFLIGYLRGGYPTIREWIGLDEQDPKDQIVLLENLLKERKLQVKKLGEIERLIRMNPRLSKKYSEERKKILENIRKLDERIDKLKGVLDEV